MNNKALILYWHGLGDVIQLTPHLRCLYDKGYVVDLMCRKEVVNSHLLDECPYVDSFIIVENPWQSVLGFDRQFRQNLVMFESVKGNYDWSGACFHRNISSFNSKIDCNSKELNLSIVDKNLEVFISTDVEASALRYIKENYSGGYIHMHTAIEWHMNHSWNAVTWVENNLPKLPIIDTGYGGSAYIIEQDINFSFVLAREASHRVYSSSVFVHACDAMGVNMDVVNYGGKVRYAWPINKNKILHIREKEMWIK